LVRGRGREGENGQLSAVMFRKWDKIWTVFQGLSILRVAIPVGLARDGHPQGILANLIMTIDFDSFI
jgi:hypothetical protein